ncbi:MAG: hypothetical protein ABEL76_12330 [Bradymonadaceae bacterium]
MQTDGAGDTTSPRPDGTADLGVDTDDQGGDAGLDDVADGGGDGAPSAPAWTRLVDGGGNDVFTDVDTDSSGNVYVAGTASELHGLRKGGPVVEGQSDAVLAKYAPDGTRKWVRAFGAEGRDGAVGLDVQGVGGDGPVALAWNAELDADENLKARVTSVPRDGEGGTTRKLDVPDIPGDQHVDWPVLARDVAKTLHGIRLVGSADDRDFGKPKNGHPGKHDDAFVATFDDKLAARKSIRFRSKGGAWDAGAAIVGQSIDDAPRWLVVHGGGPIVLDHPHGSPGSATVVQTNHAWTNAERLWGVDLGYLTAPPRTVVVVGASGGAPSADEPHADALVAGYTSGGKQRFSTTFGGEETDVATGVDTTGGDTFWVTGSTSRTPKTGDAPTHAFLARLDVDGNRVATSTFGEGGDTNAYDLATGPQGRIWIVGATSGVVGGRPANGATSHSAAFLTRWKR